MLPQGSPTAKNFLRELRWLSPHTLSSIRLRGARSRDPGGVIARKRDNPCPTVVVRHRGCLKEMRTEEMIGWLDSLAPWEIFFTGTTRYAASNRSLQRTFEGFMKRNYKHVSYIYSLEPHMDSGFHVHAMFDEGHRIKWKEFWGQWFERYGRNRTEPITHKADVESYVTKYVMKAQDQVHRNKNEEIWWNVNLSRYRKRMRNDHTKTRGYSPHTGKRDESLVMEREFMIS